MHRYTATKYCAIDYNEKRCQMQARQEAGGKSEGAYIDVRDRGLPHRDEVLRRGLFVF